MIHSYRMFISGVMLSLLLGWALAKAEEAKPVGVYAVAYSPDGTRLAIGFGGREDAGGLLIWNIETKQVEKHLPLKPGVASMTFSPDGKLLALAQFDHAPQVFKWPSLDLEFELEPSRRGPVAFSPDSQVLATSDQFFDRRREIATGKELPLLTGIRRGMYSITFSSDGKQIASAGWEGGAIVWDTATSEQKLSLKHANLASCVLFSPDNRWLITSCFDGGTRLWNAQTGEVRAKYEGTGGVDKVAYSKVLETLIMLGTGDDLFLFPLILAEPTTTQGATIREHITQLDDDSLPIREAASAELMKFGFIAEAELARAAQESPSAQVRMSARRTRHSLLSKPAGTLKGHTARVWCMSLDPNGKRLATGSEDGTVRLWDLASRQQVAMLTPAVARGDDSGK